MTESLFDAAKRSRVPFTVAAFKAISTSDELFGMLPFVPKYGEGFSYTREVSLGNFNAVADAHTSVAQSTGTDETIIVPKREFVEDFYVRNFAQENMADLVSPMDRETMRKFKAAGRALANDVIGGGYITGFTMSDNFAGGAGVDALVASSAFMDTLRGGVGLIKYTHTGTLLQFQAPGDNAFGDTVSIAAGDGDYTLYSDNPSKWITITVDASDFSADGTRSITFTSTTNTFDGLAKLMSPSRKVLATDTANGDAVSFAKLDQLLDMVRVRENLAFVCNSAIRNKIKAQLRSVGGLEPMPLMDGTFQVPSYEGVPILKNDWIPSTETGSVATTLSSIYLVSLSPEQGFWMGALGGDRFDVEGDPRSASTLGFRLKDLGQIQGGPSAEGRRLMFFGAPALGSDLAAARSSQLITA